MDLPCDPPAPLSAAAQFGARYGGRLEEQGVLVARVAFWQHGLPGTDVTTPTLELGIIYDDSTWQQRMRLNTTLIEAERYFAAQFRLVWTAVSVHP